MGSALGFTSRRAPRWARHPYRESPPCGTGREVVLFTDTFNRYFEPENARAARDVLDRAGYRVVEISAPDRPLCCGRSFLVQGLIDEARIEARRLIDAFGPYAERGVPIIGLEPSCIFTLRDEYPSLYSRAELRGLETAALSFEEFLSGNATALPLRDMTGTTVKVHGHCHQKAFGVMPQVLDTLRLIPGIAPEIIDSGCCGMAGSFGYEAEHFELSMTMAEDKLLPAIRRMPDSSIVIACGTSCRHQIFDGSGVAAIHPARLLVQALQTGVA
jgi:Fe-S oxidoreductase